MSSFSIKPAPDYLDGAKVLKWAWSGDQPFGVMKYSDNKDNLEPIKVYGLAICIYEKSNSMYRFSCDKDWEVVNDSQENSIQGAIDSIPEQYKNAERVWYEK
ncbi:MAG TPA: hypothetical protein VKT28_11670 [Puia sp.]|nr:hypothetical protein [Puia sp.]